MADQDTSDPFSEFESSPSKASWASMSAVETVDGHEHEIRILNTLLGKLDFMGNKKVNRDVRENPGKKKLPKLPERKPLKMLASFDEAKSAMSHSEKSSFAECTKQKC